MHGAETVAEALLRGRRRLVEADVDDAGLDARLLLEAATGLDHASLIGEGNRALGPAESAAYESLLARRSAHEPVSKILGRREFYGRTFVVTRDVLDPRPDTETLVSFALEHPLPAGGRLLDLGSGSGAIICTLLAEWSEAEGTAVDLSPAALAVTAENAARLGVAGRLALKQGAWFEPVSGLFELIVSNPPYIPTGEISGLQPDVRNHDPHLALDGGQDGLDDYRAISSGAGSHLAPGGRVIVEIGAGQAPDVIQIFQTAGFQHRGGRLDLGGHLRTLLFTMPD